MAYIYVKRIRKSAINIKKENTGLKKIVENILRKLCGCVYIKLKIALKLKYIINLKKQGSIQKNEENNEDNK